MINTVIFDFDGTVADTTDLVIDVFNKFTEEFNLPEVNSRNLAELKNSSAVELMKKYKITPLKLWKMTRVMQAELSEKIDEATLVPGMDKVFESLQKNNIRVGIVTSNSEVNVNKFLSKYRMQVDFVHGERNIFGKGKVLRSLIKRLKLLKDEVIYVGDEVRDIEAARYAGIKIMAVTWGFNSEKRLREAKPDFIVNKPEEIYDQI